MRLTSRGAGESYSERRWKFAHSRFDLLAIVTARRRQMKIFDSGVVLGLCLERVSASYGFDLPLDTLALCEAQPVIAARAPRNAAHGPRSIISAGDDPRRCETAATRRLSM